MTPLIPYPLPAPPAVVSLARPSLAGDDMLLPPIIHPVIGKLGQLADQIDGPDWTPAAELFRDRPRTWKRCQSLHGAEIYHDKTSGGAILAVGRVRRRDAHGYAWFASYDGIPVGRAGCPLLFSSTKKAKQAASLSEMAASIHRFYSYAPAAVASYAELSTLPEPAIRPAPPYLPPSELAIRDAVGNPETPLGRLAVALGQLHVSRFRCREEEEAGGASGITVSVSWPAGVPITPDAAAAWLAGMLDRLDALA